MTETETRRGSGVLLHITSLPGPYGCGTFGEYARAFVDFLADAGYTYWQVLPFCMPDRYHSPYASYGAFSGDPNCIDPGILAEMGLLTDTELRSAVVAEPYSVAFDRLTDSRIALLRCAAERVRDPAPIDAFMEEHPHVAAFCDFMARRDAGGREPDAKSLFAWRFIEYEFFRQWAEIKKYANRRGVRVIGDIPIYVSADSADVFEDPSLFQLDRDGNPTDVAGVPPDAFCEDGQRWGNPLYDWKRMKEDGYRWWRDRVAHNLTLFDGLRLDHFRGFEAYYAIPASDDTARNGKWRKGPGMPFIRAIKEAAGDKLMIAEDLGVITPEVEKLVRASGFSPIRVFQFAFDEDGSRHLPYAYPANAVAYTGTHDNNTLLGFVFEASPDLRAKVFDYCDYHEVRYEESCTAIRRTLLASHAGIVIFPVQDILGYGADTRMNTPGTAVGNWAYRVTAEQLRSLDRAALRHENAVYGRI